MSCGQSHFRRSGVSHASITPKCVAVDLIGVRGLALHLGQGIGYRVDQRFSGLEYFVRRRPHFNHAGRTSARSVPGPRQNPAPATVLRAWTGLQRVSLCQSWKR